MIKAEEEAIVIDDDEPIAEDEHNFGPPPTLGNTDFDVQLAICKETNFEEDPDEKIIRRLIKFFEYNRQIEPGKEYFCPRKECEVSEDIGIIDTQIIIHGLDFMKLKDVKREYGTNNTVRINPSNFKLIYPDCGTAWKALARNAREPSALVGKLESENS